MFPIYMWINRYKGLENFEITFDNNYKIEFDKDKGTLSIIKKDITDNNIKNFYSIDKTKGNIDSVNLLIGKNGSGKTSILEVFKFEGSHIFPKKEDKRYNIILYKSSINDKDFILEIQEKRGYRISKFIEIENFQEIIIEDELCKDYQDNRYYIENTGLVKFSLKKIISASQREIDYINSIYSKIYKLNMGLENGSKKSIYDFLINKNQEKNNFENAYLTLIIPNLDEKLSSFDVNKIRRKVYDLSFKDNIKDIIKLYNVKQNSINDIIINNYLNYLYLEKVSRDLNKKEKISKKNLKKEKEKILKLLIGKSSFEKIKILLNKIEQVQDDWIDYDEKKYKIIEEIANLVKEIPKEEKNKDIEDSRIIKKYKINCKKENKKIRKLLEKYDSFHTPNTEEKNDTYLFKEVEFIKIEEEGLSDGEKIKLGYFSTLYSILNGEFKNKKYVTLLFDEVETYLHPEWSRRFLYELIEELGRYEDKKFKLILVTHSPFLIADVLAKDCIYLSKNEKGEIKAEIKDDVKTFGANIIDLFKNTMFLESTFGKFATEKIKGIVDKIEKAEKYSDIKHEVDFIIGEIGEKLISNKLKSMIESKFENKDEEYYKKKIEEYQKKLDELKKEE